MISAALIEKYGKTIYIDRTEPGKFVDGFWVDGEVFSAPIKAVCQPLSGRELEALPELENVKKTRKFYFINDVNYHLGRDPIDGDVVIEDGEKYKIQGVEKHTHPRNEVLPHTKAVGIMFSEAGDC